MNTRYNESKAKIFGFYMGNNEFLSIGNNELTAA